MTLASGVLGNRYHLEGVVGQGGMAVVYRAQDTALERPVAIKVLREQFGEDPEFLERFRREARAAASLSHPNVVMVYDVGRDGSTNFIVMEYVEGRDLKDVIRRDGPLPPARLVNLGGQLAAALDYAHRHGLIHRDVKPHNVLVTRDDHLKVGDFGIAVALGSRSITQAGMVIGSVQYMAPEQIEGQPGTPASDVYALGVVLYEMATGRLPFDGESQMAVAQAHLQRQPTPPNRLNPRLPPPLSDVIMATLAKNPRDRLQSAAEVAAALQGEHVRADQRTVVMQRGSNGEAVDRTAALAAGTAAAARRPTAATRVVEPAGRPAATGTARGGGGSVLRWFLPLALLLGAVGAGLGWFLASPPAPSSPRPTPAPVIVASPTPTQPPTAAPKPAVPTAVPKPPAATATPSPAPPTVAPPTATPPPPTATPPPPTAPPTAVPKPTVPPTLPPARVQMPSLVGRAEADARRQLQQAGLDVELKEERGSDAANGLVVAQDPPPGTQVVQGRRVTITVGRPRQGPPPKTKIGGARVPNVEGMDERQARRVLQDAGFKVDVVEESAPDRKGQVVDQRPGAGDTVEAGVTVTISIGS